MSSGRWRNQKNVNQAHSSNALTSDSNFVWWLRREGDSRCAATGSGTMNKEEVTRLMMSLNIFWPADRVKEAFDRFDDEKDGELSFAQFVRLYSYISVPTLLSRMVKKLATNGNTLDEKDLLDFLHNVQHEDHLTAKEVKAIAQALMIDRSIEHQAPGESLQLDDFAMSCLMFHEDNSLLNPYFKALREEEMKRPLTHYWISTSHNTYLTGDQLLSDSASHMYRLALNNGVRCVELDCWDGPKGRPLIYHGHTLTSRITFEEVRNSTRGSELTLGFTLSIVQWRLLLHPPV
jgi:hypothetical protein